MDRIVWSALRWPVAVTVVALTVLSGVTVASATSPPQNPVALDVATVPSTVETTSGVPCTVANFTDACGSPITMSYGQGTASRLASFTVGVGATRYEPTQSNRAIGDPAVDVRLLRVDNANIQGTRQLIWMSRPTGSTDLRNVIGTDPGSRTMADILGDPFLTDGTDNLFANGPVGSTAVNLNNIERVSFLTSANTVVEPSAAGLILIERGGGDSARLAAVLSRDSSGEPTSWGPPFTVPANAWSTVVPARPSTVLRKTSSDALWRPTQNIVAQALSGVFVSFAEMGIASGATIYGFSLVAGDQTGFVGPWVTTTPDISVGGLDLIGVIPVDRVAAGSVSGTLYADADADGAFTAADTPLAQVGVDLVDADGTVVQRVLTAANGSYTFADLPPAQLRVRPDSATVPASVGAVPSAEPDATLDGVALFSITAAQPTPTAVNFGFPPAAVVSGSTTDSAGAPIASVTMQLLAPGGAVIQTTTTGADGSYAFPRVLAGQYQVRQMQPARYLSDSQRPGPGSSDDGANLIGVAIGLGVGSANNDFIELAPSGVIGGTVETTSGLPLSGIAIELLENGTVASSTTTDSTGRYEFGGLLGGAYQVRQIQPPGYASSAEQPGSGAVSVAGSNLFTVALAPGATAVDNGFVEFDPLGIISGEVIDDTGRAMAGVTVLLLDAGSSREVARAQSDLDGSFTFDERPGGSYKLRVIHPAGFVGDSLVAGSNATVSTETVIDVTIDIDGQSLGSVFVERAVPIAAGGDSSQGSVLVTTGWQAPTVALSTAVLLLASGMFALFVSIVARRATSGAVRQQHRT